MNPYHHDPYEQQQRLFADWYGLWPAKARRACPRIVAGKRCHGKGTEEWCVCFRHRVTLDHPRLWLDKHGRHVFTAEPYRLEFDDLAAVAAEVKQLGLRVRLNGRSPWNPGRTFLILITREES